MTVRPFSNGTEHQAWDNANCCRCGRWPYGDPDYEPDAILPEGRCGIFDAIFEATRDYGEISDEIAARMGYPNWRCAEFQTEHIVPREKTEAERMRELGVPCLPGFDG